ncbi:S49 family peptidase [Undibacter mobilis]|uniref:S49 family peptidase n=1 Tax=Undibacter mobilis TaxID=2292256 RepID=A0A371B455_9BRAD|nr:S49 family peptidase [Undibacter mobilis]RDV02314.1 S49 family peptidase [Undibacter mobilis]
MASFLENLLAPLNVLIPARFRADIPVVPVVRLSGVIGVTTPLRPGITLAGVTRTLDRAFAVPRARAVALLINSPGGSPTQSHLIFRRIRQLAEEKKIPVIAFIEDAGASGGYMLACAADEIVCDDYSIVGSIGVIGGSFGFPELMKKLGIERRIYTSGERKAMLDPFREENPDDVARIKLIQADIHAHFIELVKKRRGTKLNGDDKTLFSGEFWTAGKAIELGLADCRGELRATLRERYGDKVRTPVIAVERGFLGRRLMGAQLSDLTRGHGGFADDVLAALEERAHWSRYGL